MRVVILILTTCVFLFSSSHDAFFHVESVQAGSVKAPPKHVAKLKNANPKAAKSKKSAKFLKKPTKKAKSFKKNTTKAKNENNKQTVKNKGKGKAKEKPSFQKNPGKKSNTVKLKFGKNDLVYGPSASGSLRQLQQKAGGKLLSDLNKPPRKSWTNFSLETLNKQLAKGGEIRFDITNVKGMASVLRGSGKYGKSVTATELRHLQKNWSRFKNNVTFYKNGAKVNVPW